MVAIKAQQANAFLSSPDPRFSAYLFFGTDPGLVSERSLRLAKRLAETSTPAGDVLRFDDADLEVNPAHLEIELKTVPMFGGRKIVRATTGRRINALTIKPLVEGEPLEGVLIVEAGNLKPDEALRALFEKSPRAAAIACYSDEARDLDSVVREMAASAGVVMTPDAHQTLVARLGADRTLSRSEIEKLLIYAEGKQRIEADDVEAVVGDATEQTIDAILLATASGDAARAVKECGRAFEAGENAQMIILALQRHFQKLHRIRIALDAGRQFEEIIRYMRPPVYFKHKPILAAQTRSWTAARLMQANTHIASELERARLAGGLDEPILERLVWELAQRVGHRP